MAPKEKERTESLDKMLRELGISRTPRYRLILWNDEHNSMQYVAQSLHDVCRLDPERAVSIMAQAHRTGRAPILDSDEVTIIAMKGAMDTRGITTTIERAE